MRFSRDSDEEACCEVIKFVGKHDTYDVCCMRTKGHAGEHIAVACHAGLADGVCWCCRNKLGLPHKADCLTLREEIC